MTFAQLLDRFHGLRALVVGDLMLDEYIQGKATRISPEAPVMVIRHHGTRRVPGGAANVAQNLLALGARTSVVGVVGDDEAGDLLRQSLEGSGFHRTDLPTAPGRTTTRKTRVLADHAHQVLRIDSEEDAPIDSATTAALLKAARTALADADVLVLSDYLKGGLPVDAAQSLIEEARARGVKVVANPKPRTAAKYAGADLVSLNRAEAADVLGLWQGLPDSQAEVAAGSLRDRLGCPALITLGESGMVAAAKGRLCRVQAPKVEVYDTAGAGDTVIATVALGMAATGFARSVFELAGQTAACVVRHVGVVTPSSEDLDAIRAL